MNTKIFKTAAIVFIALFTISTSSAQEVKELRILQGGNILFSRNITDIDSIIVIPVIAVQSVTLNKSSISIEAGNSETLIATVLPSNATYPNVTWSSSNSDVATVVNGVVTGVTAGNVTITAMAGNKTATCSVEVTQNISHPALQGTNYYVIYIGDTERAMIENRIIADFTPNGESSTGIDPTFKRLWIWDNTYLPTPTIPPTGLNSFGLAQGWMRFEMGGQGWAGAGYVCYVPALVNSMKAISDNINDYYLHIAYKSYQPGRNTLFQLRAFGCPNPATVVLGQGTSTAVTPNKPSYDPAFVADGTWHHYDIPMTYFSAQGLVYPNNFVNTTNVGQTILEFISNGNPAGTMVEYDAVFIYKRTP